MKGAIGAEMLKGGVNASRNLLPVVAGIGAATGVIGTAANAIHRVPRGHKGVILHWGDAERKRDGLFIPWHREGDQLGVLDPGRHVKMPLRTTIIDVDMRDRTHRLEGFQVDHELQHSVEAAATWRIAPEDDDNLYRSLFRPVDLIQTVLTLCGSGLRSALEDRKAIPVQELFNEDRVTAEVQASHGEHLLKYGAELCRISLLNTAPTEPLHRIQVVPHPDSLSPLNVGAALANGQIPVPRNGDMPVV